MNIVRKIKINKIIPAIFTDKEKEMLVFIEKTFSELETYKLPYNYPNRIFYFKDDVCVLDLDIWYNKYHLLVNEKIWDLIKDENGFDDFTIRKIFRYMVKKIIKEKILSIRKSENKSYDKSHLIKK